MKSKKIVYTLNLLTVLAKKRGPLRNMYVIVIVLTQMITPSYFYVKELF